MIGRDKNGYIRRFTEKTCSMCHKVFMARKTVTFCSKSCAGKAKLFPAKADGMSEADKQRIRNQLNWLIKKGEVRRPEMCGDCGIVGVEIVAHHEDYTQPFAIDWLCNSCHVHRHMEKI